MYIIPPAHTVYNLNKNYMKVFTLFFVLSLVGTTAANELPLETSKIWMKSTYTQLLYLAIVIVR